MIFRIDIIKQLSYKIYLGERFGGDAILFNKINDLFPMYIIRKCFCHREYQKDSITNNLLKHHISSPKGIRDHYYDCIIHEKYNKINILKHTLGFISYSYLSNDSVSDILKKTNRKILTLLLIIPGYVYKCILVLKNNIMKR